MANDIRYNFLISFVLALLISLAMFQNVQAVDAIQHTEVVYPLDYRKVTQHLLIPRGTRTTNNDLYFLACVARTHLEHNEDIYEMFAIYPSVRPFNPTQEQIKIVKNVINNIDNECHDLYIVLPLEMLEDGEFFNYINVICNSLAFMSYENFILLTIQPNL